MNSTTAHIINEAAALLKSDPLARWEYAALLELAIELQADNMQLREELTKGGDKS